MELDDLKSLINQKLATDHTGRSADDIAMLLSHKTASVIDKLKRSLWIEILCCILIILIFGYIGIAGQYQSLRIYFSVFTVVAIIFLGIVIHLLRRTKSLSATNLPVKKNLQTIVNIIEEFVKRYFQFTMALIPICIVFSLILGYTETADIPSMNRVGNSNFRSSWQIVLLLFLYFAALSVAIYYFAKWYLKKLYGRYIVQLKDCIAELAEESL